MWLYRVMSMNRDGTNGIFYDATASLDEAVRMAQIVQRLNPSSDVTVEAERWPHLSWWHYQFHRILGTHEGFGVNFRTRHRLEIAEFKTVWPEGAAGRN